MNPSDVVGSLRNCPTYGRAGQKGDPLDADAIATEVLSTCPNCGGTDTRRWCIASDRLHRTTDQEYVYDRCSGCGVVFLKVRPLESQVARTYPAAYAPHGASSAIPQAPLVASVLRRAAERSLRTANGPVRRRFEERVRVHYDRVLPGTTFLDFGCGAAWALDMMRERGCATIGMDFSSRALEIVALRGHRTVPVSDEGWASVNLESVDFVRMNHVLEHLYHPRATLTRLRERMHPGAVVHIAVPNPVGLAALVFRADWHGLDCPRHVILYPPETLIALLREAGFSVEEVLQEPLTKDSIRSAAYWLRTRFRTSIEPESQMDSVLWRLAATLPMHLGHVLRRGDRYHVVARA